MLKVMRHTPGQNSERQFGIESPVIASTGVGADMGELYAAARGMGIRERLRILIDLDAARANSIGELAELLDSHGVGLTLHGGGLADRLAMIPRNPMGWPTWWILLTVAAHLIYMAKLADPISRFIRNGQDMGM